MTRKALTEQVCTPLTLVNPESQSGTWRLPALTGQGGDGMQPRFPNQKPGKGVKVKRRIIYPREHLKLMCERGKYEVEVKIGVPKVPLPCPPVFLAPNGCRSTRKRCKAEHLALEMIRSRARRTNEEKTVCPSMLHRTSSVGSHVP